MQFHMDDNASPQIVGLSFHSPVFVEQMAVFILVSSLSKWLLHLAIIVYKLYLIFLKKKLLRLHLGFNLYK